MNADFIVSMGVFTDRDENGELIITDVLFGLEMIGEVIYNVDVQIGIEVKYVTKICEGYDSCHVVEVLGSTSFVCQFSALPLSHFRRRSFYCFPRRPYRHSFR